MKLNIQASYPNTTGETNTNQSCITLNSLEITPEVECITVACGDSDMADGRKYLLACIWMPFNHGS